MCVCGLIYIKYYKRITNISIIDIFPSQNIMYAIHINSLN